MSMEQLKIGHALVRADEVGEACNRLEKQVDDTVRDVKEAMSALEASVRERLRAVEGDLQARLGAVEYHVEASLRSRMEQLEAENAQLRQLVMPRQAGLDCAQVKAAGFNALQARVAGYTCAEAKAAGYTLSEIRQAGYTIAETKAAGYTCAQAKEAGYGLVKGLKAAGYTCAQAKGQRGGVCSLGVLSQRLFVRRRFSVRLPELYDHCAIVPGAFIDPNSWAFAREWPRPNPPCGQ